MDVANEQRKMPAKIKRTAFKFTEPFLDADSMKMTMVDKELRNVKITGKIEIFPRQENCVKFYYDMETKEYSWKNIGPQPIQFAIHGHGVTWEERENDSAQ